MPGNHPKPPKTVKKAPISTYQGIYHLLKQTKTNPDATERHIVRVPPNFLIKLLTSYQTHLSRTAFH